MQTSNKKQKSPIILGKGKWGINLLRPIANTPHAIKQMKVNSVTHRILKKEKKI